MRQTGGALVVLCSLLAFSSVAAAEGLPELLGIDWRRLQDNPTQGKGWGGIEAADGGWLDDDIVLTAFGYAGADDFLNTAFVKNTSSNASWVQLPSAPIVGRQAVASTIIDGQAFFLGGFSYNAPFTYRDVIKLAKNTTAESGWSWTALPPLPIPLW